MYHCWVNQCEAHIDLIRLLLDVGKLSSLFHHLFGHVRENLNYLDFYSIPHRGNLLVTVEKQNVHLSFLLVSLPLHVKHSVLLLIAVEAHDDGSRWLALIGHRGKEAVDSLELVFSQAQPQYLRDDPSHTFPWRPTLQFLL